jgi:hypothetical protein
MQAPKGGNTMGQRIAKGTLAFVLAAALVISGCSAAWLQTAINDVPVVIQIVTSILQLVAAAQGKGADPTMLQQVANIGAEAQKDLQLVQSLIQQYQAAAATAKPGIMAQIDTALTTAQTNLNQILVVFHIDNPQLQATIAGSLGLALATLMEVQSLIPPPPNAPAARMKVSAKALQPRPPKVLKEEFNYIVTSHGFPEAAIH